jgi:hypothetical protein
VVWQGSAGNRRPYADLTGNPEVIVSFGRFGRLDDPAALQRPLRAREAIGSAKIEVTNRPGAV